MRKTIKSLIAVMVLIATVSSNAAKPTGTCYKATGLVTRSYKGVLRVDVKESGLFDKLKVMVNEEAEDMDWKGLYVDLTFFRDKKGENRSHSKFVDIKTRIPASSAQKIEKISCPKGLKKESLKVARAFKL